MPGIDLDPEPVPALGATVTFTVTDVPKNVKNPRVEVLAYDPDSDALIYGEAGATSDGFLLGGGGSQWKTQGGPAHCVANLFYFGKDKGQQTYEHLAGCEFDAAG